MRPMCPSGSWFFYGKEVNRLLSKTEAFIGDNPGEPTAGSAEEEREEELLAVLQPGYDKKDLPKGPTAAIAGEPNGTDTPTQQ